MVGVTSRAHRAFSVVLESKPTVPNTEYQLSGPLVSRQRMLASRPEWTTGSTNGETVSKTKGIPRSVSSSLHESGRGPYAADARAKTASLQRRSDGWIDPLPTL